MTAIPPSPSTGAPSSPADFDAPSDELFQSVYAELKKLARHRVARDPASGSLGATSLVHEVFLRLSSDKERMSRFKNKAHLFATAAEVMRWILVDRARARKRLKRGGDVTRASLPQSDILAPTNDDILLMVDEVLDELQAIDPESADLVKMKFFSDFSFQEIADATGVSYRTITRRWAYAKAWLKQELNSDVFGD